MTKQKAKSTYPGYWYCFAAAAPTLPGSGKPLFLHPPWRKEAEERVKRVPTTWRDWESADLPFSILASRNLYLLQHTLCACTHSAAASITRVDMSKCTIRSPNCASQSQSAILHACFTIDLRSKHADEIYIYIYILVRHQSSLWKIFHYERTYFNRWNWWRDWDNRILLTSIILLH